jgi:hypothetical protein
MWEIFLELRYFCCSDRSASMTAPTISGYTHPSSWMKLFIYYMIVLEQDKIMTKNRSIRSYLNNLNRADRHRSSSPSFFFLIISHAFVYCWLRCTDNENNWGQMQSCAPSTDGRRLLFCQEQLFIIIVLFSYLNICE